MASKARHRRWFLLFTQMLPSVALAQQPPAWRAAEPGTVVLPAGPGSLRGLADDPDVEAFSAQVSYSVPITLPAAQAGFRPSMSLRYQGGLGNGSLGVGWVLETARIQRSLRRGVPSYTEGDELEVVGVPGLPSSRLVSVGDNAYRVEGQGQRIEVERAGNLWAMTDQAGTRYFFGLTAQGRQCPPQEPGRVSAWALQRIIAVTGQQARFSYLRDGGSLLLEQITWGPDDAFTATVIYEERPDPTVSMGSGFRVELSQRIASIEVKSFGEVLRTYHLGYDDTFAVSRLARVDVSGRGGEGTLPGVSFGYAPSPPPVAFEVPGAEGWPLEDSDVTLSDIDGDSLADLVRLSESEHAYRKNLGGRLSEPIVIPGHGGTSLMGKTARLVDIDGDTRVELLSESAGLWTYRRLTADGWSAPVSWSGTLDVELYPTVFEHALADVDGDGQTDVIGPTSSGFWVKRNGPSGLSSRMYGQRPVGTAPFSAVRVMDDNGDGLADVIEVRLEYYVAYWGLGDGTFEWGRRVSLPFAASRLDEVELADLNRDGLLDVLRIEAGWVTWYAGRADDTLETGVELPRPAAMDYDAVVSLADVNGNGSSDVVWSAPDGALWAMDLSGGTSAGMLESIESDLGQRLILGYSSTGELAAAAAAQGEPWASPLATSMPVPVVSTLHTGDGPPRITHYGVRDGFWDTAERRFGGFLEARTEQAGDSAESTLVTQTRYHPGLLFLRALRGKPLAVEQRDGEGTLLVSRILQWGLRRNTTLSSDPLMAMAIETTEWVRHYEGEAEAIEVQTDFSEFDEHGQPGVVHSHGRTDVTGDEIITRRQYASNEALWIRGMLTEERVEDGTGKMVRQDRFFYDPSTGGVCADRDVGALSWGEVGDGLLRRAARYDAERERWVLVAGSDYDSHGNPTQVYEDGVCRELKYDPSGLHPEEELLRPSAAATLVWLADWDPATGLLQAVTGPDGTTHRVHYDPVGRPDALSVNELPPHARYVYDWQGPRPRTQTYLFDGSIERLAATEADRAPGALSAEQGWRRVDEVANGAGEPLYEATRLATDGRTWIVEGMRGRDPRGQVVTVAEPFYSALVDSLDVQLPEKGDAQEFAYDALGRVTARRLPNGAQQDVVHQRLSRTTTGMGLAPTVHALDGQGRVTSVRRMLETLTETLTFDYDPEGRITNVSLQDGLVQHTYGHDTLGHLRAVSTPDTGTSTYTYYDTGLMETRTNAVGQSIVYHYDDIGRLLVRDEGAQSYAFYYDTPGDTAVCGNSTLAHTAGRLAWVSEAGTGGLTCLGYDLLGNIEQVSRKVRGEWATRWSESSPSGLALQVVTDDGVELPYGYDAAGRLAHIGEVWQQLDLDASGRVLREQYGNGVLQTHARDAMGLPTAVSMTLDGALLYDVVAEYNDWGGLELVQDMLPGVGLSNGASYGYDLAARIDAATIGAADIEPHEFDYAYDALHNLTQRTLTKGPNPLLGLASGTYIYGAEGCGPRQLAWVETSLLRPDGTTETRRVQQSEYDAAGRMTAEGQRSLEYDAADRLIRVALGDASRGTEAEVAYDYGYDGLRIFADIHQPPDDAENRDERWFSDTHQQVGSRRRYHYMKLGERLVARIERVRDEGCAQEGWDAVSAEGGPRMPAACNTWHAGEVQYAHTSVASGPVLLTDAAGAVIEERRYEPFGVPINADHRLETHGWGDKPYDPRTGYVFHGARWRVPRSARWLTADPYFLENPEACLSDPVSCNLYSYAANNPVNFTDPTGMYYEGAARGMQLEGPASPFSSTQFETRVEYLKWYDKPIESSPVQLDDLAGAKALVTVGGAALVGAVGMVVVKEGAEKLGKEVAEEVSEGVATRLTSSISSSTKLVREAQRAGKSAQASLDRLTGELARGNVNPGLGTKSIGKGILEARARDGARVFFRQGRDGSIDILGKSTKGNQQTVINEVLRVFGN